MNGRTALLTLVVGVATFLLVTVAVTEALLSRIEFSLLVGLPVGLAAALGAITVTGLLLSAELDSRTHSAGLAVGLFSIVFLAVLFGGVLALALPVPVSLTAGVVLGTLAAILGFVWRER